MHPADGPRGGSALHRLRTPGPPSTRPPCLPCTRSPAQVLEGGTLAAYGWSGWFSLWNGLDLATYALQAGRGGEGPGCGARRQITAWPRAGLRPWLRGATACGAACPAACSTPNWSWRPHVPQVAIAWMHLTRHVSSGYLSIACSLQCILLLFRWAGAGRSGCRLAAAAAAVQPHCCRRSVPGCLRHPLASPQAHR